MLNKVNLNKLLTAFLDSEEECGRLKKHTSPFYGSMLHFLVPSTRIAPKNDTITRYIGKYEKSILDMVNAASGESDEEDGDEPINEGSATRGEEDKSSGKEKFSGVLLYSRFQSFCEGHCIREPSQDQEAVHSIIIAKLEAFSQSFCN